MRLIHYVALNGSTKVENLSREAWFTVPGSGDSYVVKVKRHCGGILAIRLTKNGGVEITEAALRDRLKEVGLSLPWEVQDEQCK